MSDEKAVPETLETIAEKITALGNSIDQRFAQVDQEFAKVDQQFAKVDQQLEETKAQLGVKIEAVDTKVGLVLEAVTSLQKHADTNAKEHAAAASMSSACGGRVADAALDH